MFDAEPAPQPEAAPETQSRRIALMACADASTQKNAARWLATAGFEVTAASSAREALEGLSRNLRPTLVVTDFPASQDDGRDLYEALRERFSGSSTPVLALCADQRQ